MRIFITGADGQLGHELQRVLGKQELVLGLYPQFNLLDPDVGKLIRAAKPEVVIHTAAFTNVDEAERNPDMAMAVNGKGAEYVAQAAADQGARCIMVSTDYVFDGQKRSPYLESDHPNPVNVYGRSKLEGERLALARCPNTLVVRTSWLYGLQGANFVKTIMRRAFEDGELRVVGDQRGSPTWAHDLAQAIYSLLELDLRGIVHASGTGDCTWYELACAIVAEMGLSTPVRQISTLEANRQAARPAYSVLDNRGLAQTGIVLPHWKQSLAKFITATMAVHDRNL